MLGLHSRGAALLLREDESGVVKRAQSWGVARLPLIVRGGWASFKVWGEGMNCHLVVGGQVTAKGKGKSLAIIRLHSRGAALLLREDESRIVKRASQSWSGPPPEGGRWRIPYNGLHSRGPCLAW